MTRALAGSYRADLARAAGGGTGFDPATGEPAAWAAPEPLTRCLTLERFQVQSSIFAST
jgi:hypothetical protein